ncbi:uncharacterized protein LOC106168909 [Lingula anatina]|uniref:Uncharacterized protein LOC106168909 n=1 Tax=Lingula anatina TaxID=7574 RepID=A0A1S3J1D7_LINAN|nr:uncharacterized protein LOC106168909 [Lingula anatina]|eukprot:XP_013403619.1 uncharacterized protein LOC106168909 [Lingula anatina]
MLRKPSYAPVEQGFKLPKIVGAGTEQRLPGIQKELNDTKKRKLLPDLENNAATISSQATKRPAKRRQAEKTISDCVEFFKGKTSPMPPGRCDPTKKPAKMQSPKGDKAARRHTNDKTEIFLNRCQKLLDTADQEFTAAEHLMAEFSFRPESPAKPPLHGRKTGKPITYKKQRKQ